MSERTAVPAEQRFRLALRLICTARQTRLYAERRGVRVRSSREQLADKHSRAAMDLVVQG